MLTERLASGWAGAVAAAVVNGIISAAMAKAAGVLMTDAVMMVPSASGITGRKIAA